MKMKLLVGLTVALLAAWTCQAVDYSNHSYPTRMFRVALGSGNAPSAADMATIRLHNGDMVLNTDDNVLYIMQATNVYTKIDATGRLTAVQLMNIPTNVVIIAANVSGAVTNASLALTRQAVVSVTNVTAAALRQANLSMTNIVVSTAYPVVGGATGSVLFVTGVTIQTETVAALTNTALTVQSATVPALTNTVLTIQTTP